MTPCFLNVDLDIQSRSSLDPLAAELSKRMFVLHSEPSAVGKRNFMRLESCRTHKGPDAAIHAMCSAIEKLSPTMRHIWTAARKEFNVGYELRSSERLSWFTLRADTLQRVANLGACLTVTYYRTEASIKSKRRK